MDLTVAPRGRSSGRAPPQTAPVARADLRARHRPLRSHARSRSRRRRARRAASSATAFGRVPGRRSPLRVGSLARRASASATASCGRATVSRCSIRRSTSAAAASRTPDGAFRTLSRTLFIDLETTGLSGGAGTVAFLVGLRLLRSRRVPGPPVPAHQPRRRARAARRGRGVLRRTSICSSPTTARRSTCR